MAARSTTWTILNATAFDFTLVSATATGGVFAVSAPNVIKSGESGSFRAESDGFATGDEGTVIYSIPDGHFSFYFDNPFIGSDDYSVTPPPSYNASTSETTGNDQVLSSRCFKPD
ncbi:hypothetical protein FBZ89_1453 [Nitrospirillum amazonense]|uniref:Uncharacterized protein n=1 Tax=Nitrospirillum amazonense TaxID=28077 RepID=A0A560EII0_9PROT|nr:hypothetical protein [Nitrospirillum amazonense]TWB09188.1 hypothetical protein FBZ89_1453 [Nitrospirillum amazonense]